MLPETPHYLLHRRRFSAAENSFMFYKNCPGTSNDLKSICPRRMECVQQFQELKGYVVKGQEQSKLTFKDFCKFILR